MKTANPLIVIILISLAATSGCYITKGTGSHNSRKGDYIYSLIKRTDASEIYVKGEMTGYEDNQDLPGALRANDKVLGSVKSDGTFQFILKPGMYWFESRVVGYRSCVSKKFKLERGDILQLHFRLKSDNRPMD